MTILRSFLFCIFLFPALAFAENKTSTPEDTCRAYFSAVEHNGFTVLPDFMDQSDLVHFKQMLMPIFDPALTEGKPLIAEIIFGHGATDDTVKKYSPVEFMRTMLSISAKKMGDAGVQMGPAQIVGSVPEGDIIHVIVRVTAGTADISIQHLEVVSLKKFGTDWKIIMPSNVENLVRTLLAQFTKKT